MKIIVFSIYVATVMAHLLAVPGAVTETRGDGGTSLHFNYRTENGQQRMEDIKYDSKNSATGLPADRNHMADMNIKLVEFRGGYSFISADGYEYTVLYKANKNGFQPYVTAHKLTKAAAAVDL